ncbi:MAG: hypothetical protein KDC95_02590 [Planctomycetes bacterium]|nr:hypothetical protein [Planctomycetota bacterium]
MRVRAGRTNISIPILPALAIFAIVLGVFLSMRLGRVDASAIGIRVNNLTGNITLRLEPGSFFYNSLYEDYYQIDKTQKTLQMRSETAEDVRIKTRDGADVRLDVEVNYRLLLEEPTILQRVIPESGVDKVVTRGDHRGAANQVLEAYQHKWIRDYSRSIVRYIFGQLSTEEFYESSKRTEKARESEKELNRLLHQHGIDVTKVVPDKFRFYEEYELKIREKKEANQEAEKQQDLARAAVEDQKRQEVEATKNAEVEIEKIKGTLERDRIEAEAEAIKIQKTAEAYAIKTKIDAEARYYQAEREAKGMLAKAKAEAEALQNLVNALAGEGGRNLVLRELADKLRNASIEGVPYATSSLIQKVSVDNEAAARAAAARTQNSGGTNR